MIRAPLVLLVGAAIAALAGCRSCSDDRAQAGDGTAAVSGPTMPTGLLLPLDAPPSAEASASSLRLARHVKSGAWAEIQPARPGDRADRRDFSRWSEESTFVSIEAMTLLHEPFARALPGFDLFLPRLFADEALPKLAAELDAFALRSQGELAVTARELAAVARDAAAKGTGLWVLGG